MLQVYNSLVSLGVPHESAENLGRSYRNLGVETLYQWQFDCLSVTDAGNGNNLVYCAPTGGGKFYVCILVLLFIQRDLIDCFMDTPIL